RMLIHPVYQGSVTKRVGTENRKEDPAIETTVIYKEQFNFCFEFRDLERRADLCCLHKQLNSYSLFLWSSKGNITPQRHKGHKDFLIFFVSLCLCVFVVRHLLDTHWHYHIAVVVFTGIFRTKLCLALYVFELEMDLFGIYRLEEVEQVLRIEAEI